MSTYEYETDPTAIDKYYKNTVEVLPQSNSQDLLMGHVNAIGKLALSTDPKDYRKKKSLMYERSLMALKPIPKVVTKKRLMKVFSRADMLDDPYLTDTDKRAFSIDHYNREIMDDLQQKAEAKNKIAKRKKLAVIGGLALGGAALAGGIQATRQGKAAI